MWHRSKIDEIIRVNHAGELCAKYIYLGQLYVIKDPKLADMLDHEMEHLHYFQKEAALRGSRLSVLMPLCCIGGLAAGFFSSLAGRKYAMALTDGVETVIQKHYNQQIEYLKGTNTSEKELLKNIVKFRDDELHHQDIAKQSGSEDVSPVFHRIVRKITKCAVFAAKII